MRKLLVILVMMFPVVAFAGERPDVHSWVCSQPGYMNKTKTYAITHVFESAPNDYEVKEEIFEESVHEKTEGRFNSGMDASCRDFGSESKAEKYLNKMLLKAGKRNYGILWIDFSGLGKQ